MPKVKFKGRTTAEIESLDIENGSLIYNIENGKTYLDYDDERIPTGGGAGAVVSDTPPENPSENDLWVDTSDDEFLARVDSEVSTTSTNAVQNQAITNYVNGLNTYSTTEQVVGTWIDGKPIYRIVLEGTINSTGSNQYILENSNIDTLINVGGIIIDGNIQFMIGRATYDTGSSLTNASRIIKIGTANNIRLDYSDVFRSKLYKAILEYTKTTD